MKARDRDRGPVVMTVALGAAGGLAIWAALGIGGVVALPGLELTTQHEGQTSEFCHRHLHHHTLNHSHFHHHTLVHEHRHHHHARVLHHGVGAAGPHHHSHLHTHHVRGHHALEGTGSVHHHSHAHTHHDTDHHERSGDSPVHHHTHRHCHDEEELRGSPIGETTAPPTSSSPSPTPTRTSTPTSSPTSCPPRGRYGSKPEGC